MPTIVFDESISITSGGTSYNGFVIHVWAEQDGNTLSWYAQSVTQYFARTRTYYGKYDTYLYFDLGCAASYITLHVGDQTSNEVMASPGTKYKDYQNTSGPWTRTAHDQEPVTNAITTSPPANRYDVVIDYRGALDGSVSVQEGLKTAAFFNDNGTIRQCHTAYINVNGTIKQCTVFINVDGAIKQVG